MSMHCGEERTPIEPGVHCGTQFEDLARARETARAWVGVIELMVMGSSNDYACLKQTDREPPRVSIVPAAPGIHLTQLGMSITYLHAESPLRFWEGHRRQVLSLFKSPLRVSRVLSEQHTRETLIPEDRVLVTWSTQCAPPLGGRYPIPFNVFLLSPNGQEQETSRMTCRIVAAFPTETEAQVWISTRLDQIQSAHSRR